jgi:NAD(P)-dependent dehydrogenase (short-subunit alcohol dehydrogenase family)
MTQTYTNDEQAPACHSPDTHAANDDAAPHARRARVALVTGAGRRIGRAIALGLAEAGWDIAVHYRQSASEADEMVTAIRALGRRAVALHADLAIDAAVRALPRQVVHLLGALDCIVNKASLFEYDKPDAFSPALLATHMQCNVAAPLLLAQELHALVPDGGQAVVINLLDQKLYNLNPDFVSYTLSKAALQTATTLLAQALAPKLRVVGVAPGITLVSGDQSEDSFARAHQVTPLGRSSTPQDIVDAVCYAANAKALTGTTLLVDGGQHLMPLGRDVMFLTE